MRGGPSAIVSSIASSRRVERAATKSPASATVRASTPSVSRVSEIIFAPTRLMVPYVGLYPTTPQNAAGRMIAAGVERPCALQRGVGIDVSPGVHRGLALGNPLEAFGHEPDGGDLAGRELSRRGSRAQTIQLASHVIRSLRVTCSGAVTWSRVPRANDRRREGPARAPLAPAPQPGSDQMHRDSACETGNPAAA